jgi:hypothetical protein
MDVFSLLLMDIEINVNFHVEKEIIMKVKFESFILILIMFVF